MAINFIQNAFSAANSIGNGFVNAADGWQSLALRAASISEAIASCGLFLSRGYWQALSLKRMPAAMTPATIPADMATCWTNSNRRHQRHQRWTSGVVVVDPGTVGVC
jgi:hypothetical protein